DPIDDIPHQPRVLLYQLLDFCFRPHHLFTLPSPAHEAALRAPRSAPPCATESRGPRWHRSGGMSVVRLPPLRTRLATLATRPESTAAPASDGIARDGRAI